MTPIGLHGEILFILAEFLLAYVYIRAFISGIKTYQLTIAYYQQYTIGWFYVDAENGELYMDDLVSFTSNGDIKLEPYISE